MTPVQRWPNHAENARMKAVSLAYRILRELAPLDDAHELSYAEITLRARTAQAKAALIIQELNGAKNHDGKRKP
jgi:hypothetical protein